MAPTPSSGLSVWLAAYSRRQAVRREEGGVPALVLWLIGTHHGFCRPFFPHVDWEPRSDRMPFPAL